jgi:hypothetical protein
MGFIMIQTWWQASQVHQNWEKEIDTSSGESDKLRGIRQIRKREREEGRDGGGWQGVLETSKSESSGY